MLGIKLICVGKMKEKHFISALAEYEKRLGGMCDFEIIELPEQRGADALEKEAELILRRLPKSCFVIAMCVEGKALSSEGFASLLADCAGDGRSTVVLIIGGSDGLHESVKNRAELRLSMSAMTLPHHLARVLLSEQVYRAMTIIKGMKYHK